jgi:hypothetical protein
MDDEAGRFELLGGVGDMGNSSVRSRRCRTPSFLVLARRSSTAALTDYAVILLKPPRENGSQITAISFPLRALFFIQSREPQHSSPAATLMQPRML